MKQDTTPNDLEQATAKNPFDTIDALIGDMQGTLDAGNLNEEELDELERGIFKTIGELRDLIGGSER